MRTKHNHSSEFCNQNNARQKSRKSDAVGNVIASFNTWAYKREQPSDMAHLTRMVQGHLDRMQPIEFVLYWGKGPRSTIGEPERDCLDFLAGFAERIKTAYAPGACIRLICTDTHARLNGHPQSSILSYFMSVGAAATARDFRWCMLGDVVHSHADALPSPRIFDRPAAAIEQLERSAARWYRGSGNPRDGAIAYYDMNMTERRAVELEFPRAIFITYSGSEWRDLFPEQLPILYMYSVRKGISVKPWFIDDGAVADTAARSETPSISAVG